MSNRGDGTMNIFESLSYDVARSGSNIISFKNEDCYVSYLANSSVGEETALWLKDPGEGHGNFWNLLGDHREGYALAFAAGGIEGMKEYYRSKAKKMASAWSMY